jgi:hypothetical protein
MSPSPDFESGASTSSATPAKNVYYRQGLSETLVFFKVNLKSETDNIAGYEKK